MTVEKWKTLRHIVTEAQRTANDLIDEAIGLLAEKDGGKPPEPKGGGRIRSISINSIVSETIPLAHIVAGFRYGKPA